MQNLLDENYRKLILEEILSPENIERKSDSFRNFEVMNSRQGPYIEQALINDGFQKETVSRMRKIKSINPAPAIVDEMAKLYETAPERTYSSADGKPLGEDQIKYLNSVYESAAINDKLLRATRIRKYQHQCIHQIVPFNGILDHRVYHPHQIDVIPLETDPETPFAFVVSAYDRSKSLAGGNGIDEKISDRNDGENQKLAAMRFVWWSKDHNIITDGNGKIVQEKPDEVENPIKELPFVDDSDPKENEFWVRKGCSLVDFALEFAVVLSDTANTNRLQAYAQAVIKSVKKPESLNLGPDVVLWLPIDEGSTVQEDFSFVSPSPDMAASMDFIDRLLSLFQASRGVDPSTVSSKGNGKTFNSALERLIAMYQSFDDARDDMEEYRRLESKLFRLILKWTNLYSGARNAPIKVPVSIPEETKLSVVYHEPQLIQTKKDIEESELKLMEKGLRSKAMVMMTIDNIDEATAIEKLKKIREQDALTGEENKPPGEDDPSKDEEIEGGEAA